MRWKGVSYLLLILSCTLLGCSSEEPSPQSEGTEPLENKAHNPQDFQPGTDALGMVKDGPGPLSGDAFSETALESVLDGFPKNITSVEAYQQLVFHIAEDYISHVQAIQQIDPTYTVQTDTQSFEISQQFQEKNRHLSHHQGELQKKKSREKQRYQVALRYLKNRIGEDAHAELSFALDNRYYAIKEYIDKVLDQKKKILKEKEQEAKEQRSQ